MASFRRRAGDDRDEPPASPPHPRLVGGRTQAIPAKARRAIDAAMKATESIAVWSISVWEIAMLVAYKRLAFTIDADAWIDSVEALPFLW